MSNPKRQKVVFLSQVTDNSKHLRGETLHIADYKYVNISSLAVLHKKLWLEKDGSLQRDHPFHKFKFIQSKAQN